MAYFLYSHTAFIIYIKQIASYLGPKAWGFFQTEYLQLQKLFWLFQDTMVPK